MATMGCEEFWSFSESWMEGERSPSTASHLTDCVRCRSLVADLDAIREAAANLPEMEPPARLWTLLRAQLEAEGLIHSPRASGWRDVLASSGSLRPALAGACLALLIVVSVSFSWRQNTNHLAENHTTWLLRAQRPIAPFAADLQSAEASVLPVAHTASSDVTAELNRNLAIVDNMISMCEKSVREDPQNEMTRDYLYTAYQQKADLLATMAQSGAEGR